MSITYENGNDNIQKEVCRLNLKNDTKVSYYMAESKKAVIGPRLTLWACFRFENVLNKPKVRDVDKKNKKNKKKQ